jgi:beta-xylosidase
MRNKAVWPDVAHRAGACGDIASRPLGATLGLSGPDPPGDPIKLNSVLPSPSRRRRTTLLTLSLLVLLAACSGKVSRQAVYPGDFPDPSVLRVGSTYYAFATQAPGGHPAIQRLTSTDGLHWSAPQQPEALMALPAWADDSGTWAPEVTLIDHTYVMYYSAHAAGGRHCLSVATAASPTDQFVDTSRTALGCQSAGETIDPTPFVGAFGDRYLLWKGPNGHGVATLYSQRMSADGLSFVGKASQLVLAKRKGWTSYNIEAPSMIFAAGKYFLFYSGGNYFSSTYAIGYAVCAGPMGPCTDKTVTAPWFSSHGNARGPGGQSFFTNPAGQLFMAYHAWGSIIGYNNGGIRDLWTDRVSFLGGQPVWGCFSDC